MIVSGSHGKSGGKPRTPASRITAAYLMWKYESVPTRFGVTSCNPTSTTSAPASAAHGTGLGSGFPERIALAVPRYGRATIWSF